MRSTTHAEHIPFGIRESDGRVVTAMDVPRGAACGCTCPVCRTPLQAHQGDILSWHFQHYADHACSGAAETGLHLFAKQIIADKRAIYLPPLIAQVGPHMRVAQPARWARLSNVRLEERLAFDDGDFIVPDILAEMLSRGPNNTIARQDILIEIVVTHFAGTKKKRIVAEQKLPTLEIHLTRTLTYDKPGTYACTADILKDAPRYWLWHEEQTTAYATLEAELRQHEIQKAELVEWRRRFSLRNAEHKRFLDELQKKEEEIRQYYARETVDGQFRQQEITQYRALNEKDINTKRRDKEKWIVEAATTLGNTIGPTAASKIIAWACEWRERP